MFEQNCNPATIKKGINVIKYKKILSTGRKIKKNNHRNQANTNNYTLHNQKKSHSRPTNQSIPRNIRKGTTKAEYIFKTYSAARPSKSCGKVSAYFCSASENSTSLHTKNYGFM